MWFALQPVDLGFTRTSPFQLVNEAVVYAPPERVFDLFAGERIDEWLAELRSVEWTSAAPHGVGSTRTLVMRDLAAKERFLAWDRGARIAFAIEALTLPFARRMLEDMQLERLGPRHTHVRYTVHYEPTVATRLLHPVVRRALKPAFGRALRALASIATGPARASESASPPVRATIEA